MEWQLLTVGLLIAVAAWYLGRETWRTWRTQQSSCGGGCRCHTQGSESEHGAITLIPAEQLASRLPSRKSEINNKE